MTPKIVDSDVTIADDMYPSMKACGQSDVTITEGRRFLAGEGRCSCGCELALWMAVQIAVD
jgi:hypothetical protein